MEPPQPPPPPTPPRQGGSGDVFSMVPYPLPPDVLRTLPEVQRWVDTPAIAAWGAPYAPTLTAAGGVAAGGGRLPSSAVPSLRHSVTVDACAWLNRGGKSAAAGADQSAGARVGSSPPAAVAAFDDDLGVPVSVKSMMYVPATSPDGSTVLGVTVADEVVACSKGIGRSGSVGSLGRWVLSPSEGVLTYAFGTEDGRHVLFGMIRQGQAETNCVMSVLRRPTIPGGVPFLVSRLSTLSQRVDGVVSSPAGLADGAVGGAADGDASASVLSAARRFFSRTVGTFGEAAVPAFSDASLASVAGQAAAAGAVGSVTSTIARMEIASSSVVVRLRAAALASAGVHPGGLRLSRPDVFRGVAGAPSAAVRPSTPRRSRIELATVPDEVTRARIVRNREAARRSNAKRRARTQEARQVAAVAAAAVEALQGGLAEGGGALP